MVGSGGPGAGRGRRGGPAAAPTGMPRQSSGGGDQKRDAPDSDRREEAARSVAEQVRSGADRDGPGEATENIPKEERARLGRPRVTDEQRPGDRRHLGERRPPRDSDGGRGEREPETDVEAAPRELPLVRDIVPR